jgi:hypothetical protein
MSTDDSDHSVDNEAGDPLEELKDFNAKNLCDKLINLSDNEFEEWLNAKKLLFTTRTCHECGGDMSYHWIKDRKHPNWRCTTRACRKELGYFQCTWFESSTARDRFHHEPIIVEFPF